MLVAVNKIDKEGAQPDRVRTEMTNLGLQPEEWGGETMFVDVSAKTKQNLDDLMESILLVAEVEELKANPDATASGQVIESKLDPGRGAVVTVLVQRGTLKIGDALVAGAHWGRVRAMHDFHGTRVKEAGPSMPVEVLGFDSVPEAGEFVRVVENDRTARSLAGERANRLKLEQQARRSGKKMSLETIFDQAARRARLRAQPRAQGGRLRLAGGLRGRDRQAPAERGPGAGRALRRRRHHGVRRQPGLRLRRGRARLQRPARRRGRPAGRPRGRRDPQLLGHLPRDRRAARRHAGHARPGGGRGDRRHRRGARDLPRLARRHDRRLDGHRRQDHPRGEDPPGPRRHGRPHGRDRLAAPRQRRRARGRSPASSAASCSRTTRTSRKATSSRRTRRARSSASSPSRCPASPRSWCSCASTCTSPSPAR